MWKLDERLAWRILRVSGLLMVVPEALPRVLELREQPTLPAALSLAGLAAFGALFWKMTGDPNIGRRTGLALLSAQTVLVFLVIFTGGARFDAALLVVVAAQLPIVLDLRQAVAWLAAQAILMSASFVLVHGTQGALETVLPQLGFQVFALSTVLLTRKIEDGRTELAQVNAELLATRALFEESSRALERVRIARELHDGLGHTLTALGLKLEAMKLRAGPETRPAIEEAGTLARQLHQEVRTAVRDLRVDASLDLARALRSLVDGVERPAVHLTIDPALPALTPAAIHVLFRSVQEAVTNTLRHAGAQNLWIECRQAVDGVEVVARDDGLGMRGASEGSGLRGMRERVDELGGTLVLAAAEPGYSMRIVLPRSAVLREAAA